MYTCILCDTPTLEHWDDRDEICLECTKTIIQIPMLEAEYPHPMHQKLDYPEDLEVLLDEY